MKTKKICKKILAIALVCVLLVVSMGAYSDDIVVYTSEDGYAEFRHQFNFDNISLETNSFGQVQAKNNANNLFSRMAVQNDVEQINVLFERYPEVAFSLRDSETSDNRIVAVGVTEAPLEYVNGNFARISSRSYGDKVESDISSRHNFTLWTIVEKSIYTGEYYTTTRGAWSTNVSTGEESPAVGDDYVLQATPDTFVRQSDFLTTWYSANEVGQSGVNYWRENGGANYIRYAVEEEPFGLGYLESFSLGVISADNGTPQNRIINSYYIHTWEQLVVSVSITANTNKEVALEITPSIEAKSWQLYSYVSFNF